MLQEPSNSSKAVGAASQEQQDLLLGPFKWRFYLVWFELNVGKFKSINEPIKALKLNLIFYQKNPLTLNKNPPML